MVVIPITSLWLPILVAGVVVFVLSSIIHMFLPYHRNDFSKLPDEQGVLDALAPRAIPPGDYVMPHAAGMEAMKSGEYRAKVDRGPVGFLTVIPPGTVFGMAPQLGQWFAFTLLVGIVSGYLAGRVLAPGADYLEVFRIVGTVAFASYSMALMQRSIWYGQRWATTLKSMFDGLIYAALTGGVFGWLWPV
jgi:hypothetical protein